MAPSGADLTQCVPRTLSVSKQKTPKWEFLFWCRKWDSFSVIGRPCLHSMLRTPRLDPKIRGGKRQHCCLFFSALRVPLSEGTTKKAPSGVPFFVVPEVGLEPTRYRYQRILSSSFCSEPTGTKWNKIEPVRHKKPCFSRNLSIIRRKVP